MRNDIFSKSVKNRGFSQNSKGGTKANFSKMADFLGKLWKLRKIWMEIQVKKLKKHLLVFFKNDSLIVWLWMERLNYHRFVLCKKPHEKTPIR